MRFLTRRPVLSLISAFGIIHAIIIFISWRGIVSDSMREAKKHLLISSGAIEHALTSGADSETCAAILDSTGILFLSVYDERGAVVAAFGGPKEHLHEADEALNMALGGWDHAFHTDEREFLSLGGKQGSTSLLVAAMPVNRNGQRKFFPASAKVVLAGFDYSANAAMMRRELASFAFQSGALLTVLVLSLAFLVAHLRKTEEKARASAEEAIWVKNQFLSNVSHELRTPLNGIMGMVSLLKETRLDKDQAELADIAGKCADSLMSLVENILLHIKFEVGKTIIEEVEFDLPTSVGLLADTFSTAASAKKIQFHFRVDSNAPRRLIGDNEKVSRILTNLLDNAVKFTKEGAVSLAVDFVSRSGDKAEMEFKVIDTGIGIPPDKLGKIFEPFSQADGSATREFGGLGMGLCLTRELVNALGGRIKARSRVGEGTEFRVVVPFRIAREQAPKAVVQPARTVPEYSGEAGVYPMENLAGRVGGDRDTALKLYKTFAADLAEKPGAIIKALDAGGLAAAARLASELKSSAGGMGAAALKKAAMELEVAKITGDAELMREKALTLVAVAEKTGREVSAIIARG